MKRHLHFFWISLIFFVVFMAIKADSFAHVSTHESTVRNSTHSFILEETSVNESRFTRISSLSNKEIVNTPILGLTPTSNKIQFPNNFWMKVQLVALAICAVSIALLISKLNVILYGKTNVIIREVCIFFIGALLFIIATYGKNTATYSVKHLIEPALATEKIYENIRPIFLDIPSIHLSNRVTKGGIMNGKWILSDDSISYFPFDTQTKNMAFYAQKKPVLFGNLNKVSIGDKIKIIDNAGYESEYQVKSKKTMKFDTTNKIQRQSENMIILFTCNGLLDESHVVIEAEFISQSK